MIIHVLSNIYVVSSFQLGNEGTEIQHWIFVSLTILYPIGSVFIARGCVWAKLSANLVFDVLSSHHYSDVFPTLIQKCVSISGWMIQCHILKLQGKLQHLWCSGLLDHHTFNGRIVVLMKESVDGLHYISKAKVEAGLHIANFWRIWNSCSKEQQVPSSYIMLHCWASPFRFCVFQLLFQFQLFW